MKYLLFFVLLIQKKEEKMGNPGLQRNWIRILLTAMTAAVMVMIFFFSRETAVKSDATSGMISSRLIRILYPDFAGYPAEQQQKIYDSIQYIVRKTAHYTEYALLGFLMRLCLESWFGKRRWLTPVSWAGSTAYAVSDELHQLLIEGRSGQWTDILLDSAGAMTGALLAALMLYLIQRRNLRKGKESCP